ncbi:DUF2764 family protein [Estrella lausannensis]|uniref:Uncharacterized protein n=1 Tax=Estrella lausannensis TaxID=483423 RepID=A0A0H5DQX8_9BACT|nr:DUF2764 family protein [Estrella lausannensis]CRX38019.1 Conserved hypothetical protein [Estrella lausannensis]
MIREYYYVGSLLPDLQIGMPPELTFKDLMQILSINLQASDLKKVEVIRRLFDIYHLKALAKGTPFSERGNFDENDLEEALVTKSGLPEYFQDYLERHQSKEERLQDFTALLSLYFNREMEGSSGFIKELMRMERDSRLVMLALRAKKFSRDVTKELQYEDPDDDLVASILAQKDAVSFDPPDEYQDLKSLYEENAEEPLKLQQAVAEWKFEKIAQMEGVDPFSIDKILGYTARLVLAEKWLELDEQKGKEIVDNILKEAT